MNSLRKCGTITTLLLLIVFILSYAYENFSLMCSSVVPPSLLYICFSFHFRGSPFQKWVDHNPEELLCPQFFSSLVVTCMIVVALITY